MDSDGLPVTMTRVEEHSRNATEYLIAVRDAYGVHHVQTPSSPVAQPEISFSLLYFHISIRGIGCSNNLVEGSSFREDCFYRYTTVENRRWERSRQQANAGDPCMYTLRRDSELKNV